MSTLQDIASKILVDNLNLKPFESILLLTDVQKESIAQIFFEAAQSISKNAMLLIMPLLDKSGQEPNAVVKNAMLNADITLCITSHSLTHTQARKDACNSGGRVATMPGITLQMLQKGALHVNVEEMESKVNYFVSKLNEASHIKIEKDGYVLTFDVEGRHGIASTGIIRNKGEYGNIPSGEAYIAPIEDSANGEILVDGSIANIGVLESPLLLKLSKGRIIEAIGPDADKLMNLLGHGNGKIIAEFGIGANSAAILCGNVLEDEKVYGTIHIAFGSNHPFGGTNKADVHIDCVVKKPNVYLNNELLDLN